jgi:asparagine synthase (glutamine-hydrolysing)
MGAKMSEWVAYFGEEDSLNLGNEFIRTSFGTIIIQTNFGDNEDSFVTANDNWIVLLQGIVLNSRDLQNEWNAESLKSAFLTSLDEIGISKSINSLTGPFTGVIVEKNTRKIYAFANQTGDTAVFYNISGTFLLSNDFNLVWEIRYKKLKEHITFNNLAAKYMLTYGYMLDSSTFVNEICRILPGEFIVYCSQDNKIEKYKYFTFPFYKRIINENDLIEEIDAKFRTAVNRCLEKDHQFGVKNHLIDVSGGFDSRMVNWVARSLTDDPITNICYSKKNERDEKYAFLVSKRLGNRFYFRAMDDADFLADIDEIVTKNYGLGFYPAITAGNQVLKSLNFNSEFGLEITGQVGDAILGSFDLEHGLAYYRNSQTIKYNFECENIDSDELEHEIMNFRGFMGCLSTHLIRKNYTYTVSPFLDMDFFNLCLSIPASYRKNHNLYYKWVKAKYPEAYKIPSTRAQTLFDRATHYSYRAIEQILYLMGIRKTNETSKGMNPLTTWYKEKISIRENINTYWGGNKDIQDSVINEMMNKMWNSPSFTDKAMALTVLSVLNNYFSN